MEPAFHHGCWRFPLRDDAEDWVDRYHGVRDFAPGYFFIACNVSFRIETKVHRIYPGSIMDFQSHPQGWKTSEPTLSANLHLRRLK